MAMEMFADPFLAGTTEYIKDNKGNGFNKVRLGKYGLCLYLLAACVTLTVCICYMTLEAFKTEVVTIGPVLLPDQNCTLLGSYNGAPLGLKGSGSSIALTSAVNSRMAYALNNCIERDQASSQFNVATFEIGSSSNNGGLCKISVKDDLRPNNFQKKRADSDVDSLSLCLQNWKGLLSPEDIAFGTRLLNVYPGKKGIPFSFKKKLNVVDNNSSFDYILDAVVEKKTDYWTEATITNKYQNLYFKSHKQCKSELKLESAKLEVNTEVIFQAITSSGFRGKNSFYDLNKDNENLQIFVQNATALFTESAGGCFPPMKLAKVNFKFNTPNFELTFGPSKDLYFSNFACEQAYDPALWPLGIQPKLAKACGYLNDTIFTDYDEAEMMAIFQLYFPNWVEEACSVLLDFPPYQCSYMKTPSFVAALGSSLAITNTFIVGIFMLAVYLLTNGYVSGDINPTSSLSENKMKSIEMKANKKSPNATMNPISTA